MIKYIFSLLVVCLISCQSTPTESYDILLKNATIYDGTMQETYQGSVAINADTIAWIGTDIQGKNALNIIDATGYILAPGFIDTHTHALNDLSDSIKKVNLNYLYQGVTTVVTGSDGNSVLLIGDKLAEWQENGIGTNAAIMTGHRTIRQRVMSMNDGEPTEEELENMKTLVRRGMEEGALGFSSGLYYAPANFATTEEVIELAKVAAEYNGIYDAHIRDESTYNIGLINAIKESIEIAEKANLPANISHIKALGVDVWGKSEEVIELIEAARTRGLQITADQYPYRASGTSLTQALVPKWVFADEVDFQKRFDDPALRERIIAGMKENLRIRGGAESLLLTAPTDKSLTGKNLAEIAKERQKDAIITAIDIIQNGGSAVASFNMQDTDIQNFMKQPWVMTCSDGTNAHPRKYATFPKKIREYVLEKKTLSLTEMIYKSTALSAQIFQIPRRGTIKTGYFADLILFKPEEVIDVANFQNPAAYSEGMKYVFVNGKIIIEDGKFNGILNGYPIKKG
ncbi:MAG: amidohydrolase family protein [Saprospiraceae bacterium]